MKHLLYLIVLILLFGSCNHNQSASTPLIIAERIFEENPDSASRIIHNIPNPDNLGDKDFLRWCLIAGKTADSLNTSLPPSYYYERAYSLLGKSDTSKDKIDIGLFWGRSLVDDGEYDKAMSIYVEILELAKDNELYNKAAYIYTYIADLYDFKDMQKEALCKYEEACGLFKKVGNVKSHVYALYNIAREWAYFDSLAYSIEYLNVADSISMVLNDNEVSSVIHNAFGNIYLLQRLYPKAESHFLQSISLCEEDAIPNLFCLIDLYLESGNLPKAYEFLDKIPQDNPTYKYGLSKAMYQVAKFEGRYQEALKYLEDCKSMIDSIAIVQSDVKIMEVEKKFESMKLREKNNQLEVAQQKHIIVICICLIFCLTITFVYFLYRQRTRNEIRNQALELNNIRLELVNTSLELNNKKKQLISVQEESESNQGKLQSEIQNLTSSYKKLQRRRIATSIIYRKLVDLAEHNPNCNNKSLLTEQHWFSIISEISETYPNLKIYLLEQCPKLTDQEWEYCCLCMFNLDSNTEARLLGINPSSVRTKRMRLRQKLGISALQEEANLCEYLANELLK